MGTAQNVKVEPCNATWGVNTAQVSTVTVVADVADSLDGKYFYIYKPSGAKYHAWYNTSGGAAVDPNPGGSTAIEIAITTGATAAAVATATASAIDAVSGFDASASAAIVTITNTDNGYASGPHEGVGTGFTFAVSIFGDLAADIGFVEGDIEFDSKEDLEPITAHQTGKNVLGDIRVGKQVNAKITFKETTKAQLVKLIRQGGGTFTPAGAGGTELAGWGTGNDFTQTLVESSKLVLHPVVLGTSDKSRDLTIHQCYAMLEGLKFSGEKIFNVPITFKVYPKLTLNDKIEYFCYGDGSQTLT